MTAKCFVCGKYWNISILARIPKAGYVCPHCTYRRLRATGPKQKGVHHEEI